MQISGLQLPCFCCLFFTTLHKSQVHAHKRSYFLPPNAAHWMMFFCLTSPEFWRILDPNKVLRRTLMWRSLQKCLKPTYLALLKLTGEQSPLFFLYSCHTTIICDKQNQLTIFYPLFSVKVCEMMFNLASKLATARTTGSVFIINSSKQSYPFQMFLHIYDNKEPPRLIWSHD